MKPALASATHAADLVAMATFYVLAPQFQPTQRMWRVETVEVLAEILHALEAERDALATRTAEPIAA